MSLAGFQAPKSGPWRRRKNFNLPGFGTKNVRSGVRVGEVQKKNKTGTLQEQITFNEARRGSNQISELLHLSEKRVSIYRHVCRKLLGAFCRKHLKGACSFPRLLGVVIS